MIPPKKINKWFKTTVSLALIGAMIFAQPQPVQAARSVGEIQKDQQNIDKELQGLDSELSSVISSIASLQAEIEQKQQEISEAEEALKEAQKAVDKQYADMKLRIQFMYENSDESVLSILLESGSIADFLNRLEYVNAVHSYDRELLDSYEAIKQEVEDMKIGLEAEKKELVASESQLENQKSELSALVSSKKLEKATIDKELKAAQEEARRQQAQVVVPGGGGNSGGGGGSTGTNQNLNPTPSTGVSGSAVVAFANQFVGNPYVWGGNSLTNGCDCSGFVNLVYANFGISVPRYSGAFASVGQEVSYNNMQAGDIIVYEPKAGVGHVAIYAGNGCIVEAQSSAAGITNNRAANCRSIRTIRRVL